MKRLSSLFLVSLLVMSQLGRSFLPEFNEGSLVVSVVSLPGISLEESNKIGIQVEKALLAVPEIKKKFQRICALVINLNNSALDRFPDAKASVVFGIGHDAWQSLNLTKTQKNI